MKHSTIYSSLFFTASCQHHTNYSMPPRQTSLGFGRKKTRISLRFKPNIVVEWNTRQIVRKKTKNGVSLKALNQENVPIQGYKDRYRLIWPASAGTFSIF